MRCKKINNIERRLWAKLFFVIGVASFPVFVCAADFQNKHYHFSRKITKIEKEAWVYYFNGEHKKARKIIVKQVKNNDLTLTILSGTIYWRQNECGKALEDINIVKSIFDKNFKLSDFKKAYKNKNSPFTKEELDDILKYHYIPLYYVSGYCSYSLKQWQESIPSLNKYLALRQNDGVMQQYLGTSYTMLKKYKEAIPPYDKAYKLLSKIKNKDKRTQEYIKNLISITLYNQIIIYFNVGDIGKTKKYIRQSFENTDNKQQLFDDMKNDQDFKPILNNNEILNLIQGYIK